MNLKKIKIGILGGSFDPAHKGHLAISKEAKNKLNLKQIIWAITKKNPFKKKSSKSLFNRIKYCKKIIGKNKYIKIKFYEDTIKSNKTFNLINYLTKNKGEEIDRHGYKKRSLNSITFKRLNNKNLKFIKFNKVNISSSKLRKI